MLKEKPNPKEFVILEDSPLITEVKELEQEDIKKEDEDDAKKKK
jgi:hypothetical protein